MSPQPTGTILFLRYTLQSLSILVHDCTPELLWPLVTSFFKGNYFCAHVTCLWNRERLIITYSINHNQSISRLQQIEKRYTTLIGTIPLFVKPAKPLNYFDKTLTSLKSLIGRTQHPFGNACWNQITWRKSG